MDGWPPLIPVYCELVRYGKVAWTGKVSRTTAATAGIPARLARPSTAALKAPAEGEPDLGKILGQASHGDRFQRKWLAGAD